ncbi:hypothetical protein [Denitrobaculum tricleocarpae]|uniref:Uncharacterized protein n=1 Tax=Denitrobaculum tricleocarpae TaxID=2591009 RepID=A0A545T408_9PROT|nr:hypothetical protein [Denitrobaculum tricleocarpae]TQV71912.1 hypothetical protein FKG95_26405 [Denitrobaculum tricleocarpae]
MIFPWRIFVTIVPLMIALLALQFFVPDTELRATMAESWWQSQLKPAAYSGGFIGYATAVSVHILICIVVIAFNLYHIRACEKSSRRRLLSIAIAYLLLLSGLLIATNHPGLAAYKITFLNFRELYAGSHLFDVLQTMLGVQVIVPTLFGIAAVIFAATGAESLFVDFDKEAPKLSEAELKAKIAILKRGFQSLSIVLVSTTIAAAVFFHLPARLYKEDGEKIVTAYADEVTIFWGAIFTLTLIATYAPHLFRLRSLSKSYAKALKRSADGSGLPEWLSDTALFGNFKTHLTTLFTLLAPLITGSLSTIIQSLPL